jgi:thioredoxin 1
MGNRSQSVNSEQLEKLIQNNEIVFVDFWAEWCAPCKQFAVVYEKISAEYENIVFAKINIAEEQELADVFQIRSIPHLMVFKQEIVVYSEAGSMPESTLKELVQQAQMADVSSIKAQLEKEKKE